MQALRSAQIPLDDSPISKQFAIEGNLISAARMKHPSGGHC
jgi:hypothetical protein